MLQSTSVSQSQRVVCVKRLTRNTARRPTVAGPLHLFIRIITSSTSTPASAAATSDRIHRTHAVYTRKLHNLQSIHDPLVIIEQPTDCVHSDMPCGFVVHFQTKKIPGKEQLSSGPTPFSAPNMTRSSVTAERPRCRVR